MTATVIKPAAPSSTLRTALFAGLSAGAVDAAYFTIKALVEGRSPVGVLQGIGGFWIGKSAASASGAVLGAVTHFGLATAMAAGFVLLRPRVRLLQGSAITSGAAYGVFLYLIMYLVVMPLRWPQLFPRFDGWSSVLDVLVHIAVGITIAAVTGQAQGRSPGR